MPFYDKGNVRIRYEEVGAGFLLLVNPGGGLNSRVDLWPTQVFNAMEEFKNDCWQPAKVGQFESREIRDCFEVW